MMKKLTALLLMLLLVAGNIPSAFAWYCPECKVEVGSKFCTGCGTAEPASTPEPVVEAATWYCRNCDAMRDKSSPVCIVCGAQEQFCPFCGASRGKADNLLCTTCYEKVDSDAWTTQSIVVWAPDVTVTPAPVPEPVNTPVPELDGQPVKFKVAPKSNGTVNITWTADGTTNYRVQYIRKFSDDPLADENNPQGLGMMYGESRTGSYTLNRLVPGISYWIGVFDNKGNGEYKFLASQTKIRPFDAFDTELILEPCFKVGDARTLVTAFSLSDVQDRAIACGVRAGIACNNTNDEIECSYQVVLEDPNGSVYTLVSSMEKVKAWSESVIGGEFYNLSNYFERLKKSYGSIPAGAYTMSIFLDGRLVGAQSFQVSPAQTSNNGLRVTNLKLNDNGTVTVSWADNGHGPFSVNYVDCWSNDIEADKKNIRTSACWSAATSLRTTTMTLEYLIPGHAYWIEVVDSRGNSCDVVCNMPSFGVANMGMQVSITPRVRDAGEVIDYGALSAKSLNQNYSEEYGLLMQLTYDAATVKSQKHGQVVLTLPNGVCFCLSAFDLKTSARGHYNWNFYDLDETFALIKQWYGKVTEGKYTVDIYVDGKLAGSTIFRITTQGERVATGMYIRGATCNADGSATFRWSDELKKGPYRIEYGLKTGNSFPADHNGKTFSVFLQETTNATGPSYKLENLAPGENYWIVVYNSEGKYEYTAYEPGTVQKFPDFSVGLTARIRTRRNNQVNDVDTFSAANIARGGMEFGARIELSHPQLRADRLYTYRISITAPNGAVVAQTIEPKKLPRGSAGKVYWVFVDFSECFAELKETFGSVPIGEYMLRMYFDTYYVADTTFSVTE